jgi:hypothetical protein
MRFVFLILLLIGVMLGIGYPWAVWNFSGEEIGSWRVFDRPGPYNPVTVRLTAADAPVRAFVDMQPLRNFVPSIGRSALTAVVTRQDKDVLVATLTYENTRAANKGSPQGPQVFRDSISDIDPVEDGNYTFTIGPGDIDGLEVAQVDLILRRGAAAVDWRAMPAGIALVAISIVGLVRLRRRRAPANSAPHPPKWGR